MDARDRASRPARRHRWPLAEEIAGRQTLELHVTGRRSGQKRSTMLTAPIREIPVVVCEPA